MNYCVACDTPHYCAEIRRCFLAGIGNQFDSDVTDEEELNEIKMKPQKSLKKKKLDNFDEGDFLQQIIYT